MELLRVYLNSLSRTAQDDFARRCRTTVGYLRKAISLGTPIGEALCINIDRESNGAVPCEQLRPQGVDWAYLRGHVVSNSQNTKPDQHQAHDTTAQTAIKQVANHA